MSVNEMEMKIAKLQEWEQLLEEAKAEVESLKDEIEPFIKGELSKIIGKGFSAKFSKNISGGFKIGPKDGSYFISLTDETFEELISEYLRPATRKVLFGE